jgi:nitrilase
MRHRSTASRTEIMDKIIVSAAQAAPVFLDRAATIEKACDLISTAARNGARLIVFPEAFVPTYPDWAWVLPPNQNRQLAELYAQLVDQSVTIPSADTEKLCRAARESNIYVVMGVNERNTDASGSSLFNTLIYINNEGILLGKHRKLIPTAAERMVWAQGDGSTLEVYDTPFGKLGGLICWENYMPLARYTMYAWGTQIYVAATWDCGEPWLSTLRHIAKEGRVYVIGCCCAINLTDIPDRYEFKKQYAKKDDWVNVGDSAIVDPDGKFIVGPLNRKEGILYAEINLSQVTGPRWKLDVAGHYSRPDVFQLTVNRQPHPVLRTAKGADPEAGKSEEGPPAVRNEHEAP